MSGQTIVPCLWMSDQAEEAAAYYLRLFPAGRVTTTSRYPASGDNPAGRPPGSVLTVEFEVAGFRFTALNGGPIFRPNPSVSFFVEVGAVAEADRLFSALVAGGEPLMPIGRYPWSERYGWVKDRFGVSWQVLATGRPGSARIVPCLMFSGKAHGRAEEAIEAWTGIFPRSRTLGIERYAAGEGPVGKVKHGRFVLVGQELVAMDAHADPGIAFDEGLSLQIACRDQAEVDAYWSALGAGGHPGPCGWLQDRFGLSWQVVPAGISAWMTSDDVAARDRAFAAMMKMGKPDVAALQRAFEG